jgi:hypothetical protein
MRTIGQKEKEDRLRIDKDNRRGNGTSQDGFQPDPRDPLAS